MMVSKRIISSVAFSILLAACSNQYDEGVVRERYLHRYGVEVTKDHFDNEDEGTVVSTLNTGVVVSKSLSQGMLNGDMTYTYPHSSIVAKVETYQNGTLIAVTQNDTSGEPRSKTEYLPNQETRVTRWYAGGMPEAQEHYVNGRLTDATYYNSKGQPETKLSNGNGTRPVRDNWGQLISNERIQDGIVVEHTTYHPNGGPSAVTPVDQDQSHGQRKIYSPSGEPTAIENWSNGKQEGITTLFHNGERMAEVPYKNGKKNGVEKRYRDGEILVEEITWVDDQMTGPYTRYIEGQVQTDYYYQGQKVPKPVYDQKMRTNR